MIEINQARDNFNRCINDLGFYVLSTFEKVNLPGTYWDPWLCCNITMFMESTKEEFLACYKYLDYENRNNPDLRTYYYRVIID